MTNGTYILTLANGYFYVGSSKNTDRRVAIHKSNLSKGVHRNKNLQAAFDVCGNIEIQCSVFSTRDREQAYIFEQRFLDMYKHNPYLCNISHLAKNGACLGEDNSMHGVRHTFESKELMSQVKISKNLRGANNKNYGRNRSLETIAKLRTFRETNGRSLNLNGVVYPTLRKASRDSKIPRSTIKLWLGKNRPNCHYIEVRSND